MITGRITEINDKEEFKFGVSLTCRKADLERHDNYVNVREVHADDLVNEAF